MKTTKLRMIIKTQGYTQKQIADKLFIAPFTLAQKLDDPLRFTQIERRKLAKILKIRLEDIV